MKVGYIHMDYSEMRRMYLTDAAFHDLVHNLVNLIERLHFTPVELRQAAVFASMIHEERHPRPIKINMCDLSDEDRERLMSMIKR